MRLDHGLAQPGEALARVIRRELAVEQGDLAQREREVLRQAVVDVGGEPYSLALQLGAVELVAQARGRDADAQLVAEQPQNRQRRRVQLDRHRPGRHHDADELVRGEHRQREPIARLGLERVVDEPARRLVEDDGMTALDREPPRLGVERELFARARAGRGLAITPQRRPVRGRGQVQGRRAQRQRAAHLAERVPGQLGERPGTVEGARHAADRAETRRHLGWEPARETARRAFAGHCETTILPVGGMSERDERPTRVLIADDHRLMREGTAALLRRDERIEVVGLAADGREALSLADRRAPDVALVDLKMPRLDGIETCAALRARRDDLEVLILTVSEREEDLYAALRVGAAGYLLKDMPPRELIDAVVEAGRGEPRIAPALAGRMLEDMGSGDDPLAALSAREREVLSLLAAGLRNREIAERLGVGEATVKTHVRHVLEKLRFRNRAEAAAFAARHLP